MNSEIDHGPIIAQKESAIKPNDTSFTLTQRLAKEGAQLFSESLPQYIEGKTKPKDQEHGKAIYTYRLKKEAGLIDWRKSALEIERQIRAMQPWPKAYTILPDGKRLIIYSAKLTGGKLDLGEVQLEGKQKMQFSDFIKGYRGKLDFGDKIVYND
jgi:methionyl-tRNA formyltransferase